MFKLIIALDFNHKDQAYALLDHIDPNSCALKVGSEMFTRYGASFVKTLHQKNFRVFLDLKFHDIPNTVAQACRACADLGVWMLNIHASGGAAMIEAAKKALEPYKENKPLLIAVTVLTHMDENALNHSGINQPLSKRVLFLSKLAKEFGCDGVVCSALEAKEIKNENGGSFLTVTPGIRLSHDSKDDQKRVVTPDEAFKMGSDYIVMGRSITKASDPNQIIKQVTDLYAL